MISEERLIAGIAYGTYRGLFEVIESLRRFPAAIRTEGASLALYESAPLLLQEYRRIVIDQPHTPVQARETQEALLRLIDAVASPGPVSIHASSAAAWAALEELHRFVFGAAA